MPEIIRCESLQQVRDNIDRIDVQMVALLAEREGYVRQAARFKTDAPDVVVPARVEEVVAKVTAEARKVGGSTMVAEKTYRVLIDAITELEREEHRALTAGKKG